MDPFEELSLLKQVRLERIAMAQNRLMHHTLMVKRHLAEARLEQRRLDYLTSLPAFRKLSEEVLGLVSFIYIWRRSRSLTQVVRGVKNRNAAAKKLAELSQSLAGEEQT